MDVRIVYRDILIPARQLMTVIPSGKKVPLTVDKKEAIILAAFRDHFSTEHFFPHVEDTIGAPKRQWLRECLSSIPGLTTEQRNYLQAQLPKEVDRILEGYHMRSSDYGDYLTQAIWGEAAYSLRYTRNCVVFRFPRVLYNYKNISAARYIFESSSKASLRTKCSSDDIKKASAHLPYSQLLRTDLIDYFIKMIRG